jgi:hypothetical protein
MLETLAARPLLELDPELGQLLSPERLTVARTALVARTFELEAGAWRPETFCAPQRASNVGLLVIDGVLARELCVHDTLSAELLGPGDVIRTWHAEGAAPLLVTPVRWHVLEPATVALLDHAALDALRRYPEVLMMVLDRLNARAERLAVTQAISQITGVDTRVEALLWHFADRWGRVGLDGVIVPLALSHRLIAALVGARRPTVSTALAHLAEQGRVLRRPDGTWLLAGTQPAGRSSLEELLGTQHDDRAEPALAA